MTMSHIYSSTQHYSPIAPIKNYFSYWKNNLVHGKLAETLYKLREI